MRSITWKRVAVATTVLSLLSLGSAPSHAADAKGIKGGGQDASKGVVDSLWGDDDTREGKQAAAGPGAWDASKDLGSMDALTKAVGAQSAWAQGVTGKDVTVALIDTGVAPVRGLDGDKKVVDGPDLSFEGQTPGTRYVDGYGHGTHMAGIIAGEDKGFDPKRPDAASFSGVAPDATLLNMKVASGDGGADVSQVIAAIDWVVEHRADRGMHVRVINLSYGTNSAQSWQVDPLARAVENAWNNGILVVAAAGNNGLDTPSLLMPAVDPHVLAVGAADHMGTEQTEDDVVADFTNGGNLARHADLLAPGKSVVSLRVPSSYVDMTHPEGRVPQGQRFFRGSGTSQAAAVVAGEAALLFQAQPKLTPDQAKAVLMQTSSPLSAGGFAQGEGVAEVGAAVTLLKSRTNLPTVRSAAPASSGLGSLEAARGGEHVVDPQNGSVLEGEVDAQGAVWNPREWVDGQNAHTGWAKGVWNTRVWAGTKWDDQQLRAAAWTGMSWSGVPWTAQTWSGDEWLARSWRGGDWEARSWREDSWEARSWRAILR